MTKTKKAKTKPAPKAKPVGRPREEVATIRRFYDSMSNCAGETKTPLALLKNANKKGCKAFKHGRVDFLIFLEWLFTDGMNQSGINWHEHGKKFQALSFELNYEERRKVLMDFSIVEQFISNLVGKTFFGELDRLSQEYPPSLKGKSEIAIHEECIKQHESIKSSLRKQLASWLKKNKPEDEQ